MIDSLASQVGESSSPYNSSNPNSAIQSRGNSSLDTRAHRSGASEDISLDDVYGNRSQQNHPSPHSHQGHQIQAANAPVEDGKPAPAPTNYSTQLGAPNTHNSSLKGSHSSAASTPLASYPARNVPPVVPHDREDSTDSMNSEEAYPKTISASAFKRGGGLPSHPAQGRMRDGGRGTSSGRSTPDSARETPSSQFSHLPLQSQQPYSRGLPEHPNATPRQYERSIPPAQYGSQQAQYQGGHPSPQPPGVYNSGIPQGAAPPSRYGVPGDPVYQQHQQSPRQANGMLPQRGGSGPSTPISPVGSGAHIPAALIPGRPGSAAPLAPIGHTGPAPRNFSPSPPAVGYSQQPPQPYLSSPVHGSHIIPPWQQGQRPPYQHQYSGTPTPVPTNRLPPPAAMMGQRAPSPLSGPFDGSSAHLDAYGGMENDSPYAGVAMNQGGPGGYGRQGGPPMQGPPMQGRSPVGQGYGRGGW